MIQYCLNIVDIDNYIAHRYLFFQVNIIGK